MTVTLEEADGRALLSVSDTGMGIAPEFLPHVFNRFSQEDGSTTRVYGGLGLGLAIVRHLVEAHGGTVKAESPGPGKGATITVTLPLMPVREELDDVVQADAAESSRGNGSAAPAIGERATLAR